MTSEELYYDHYKNTFDNVKSYLKQRDKLTVALFAVVSILSFQSANPNQSTRAINAILSGNITGLTIDFRYINTVLLFIFLWLTITYYQKNLLIERMYSYLHKIENKLSESGQYMITREGINYLKNYPALSYIVHRIYTMVFPLLIAGVAISRLHNEYIQDRYIFFLDAIALILITVVSLIYYYHRNVWWVYFNRTRYPRLYFFQRILGFLNIVEYDS